MHYPEFCRNGYFAYVESYEKKGMTLSSTHFHSQTYTLVLLAIILGQWGVIIIPLYKSENKTISGAWIYSGLGKEFHSQICKGNETILSLLIFIVDQYVSNDFLCLLNCLFQNIMNLGTLFMVFLKLGSSSAIICYSINPSTIMTVLFITSNYSFLLPFHRHRKTWWKAP